MAQLMETMARMVEVRGREFKFIGRERVWNPLPGVEPPPPPTPTVFDVTAHPTGRVAIGGSMQEAEDRLVRLLERVIDNENK